MSEPVPESAWTLLPFVEQLANSILRARASARAVERGKPASFTIRGISLTKGEATVEVSVNAMGGLIALNPRIRFEILDTAPERTELRWTSGDGGGFSRVAGKGLSLMPQEKIDEWVRNMLGEGVRVVGDRVFLDHRLLVERLLAGNGGT